ncbi:MAG: hypothetical protein ACR2HR_12485 [Euzebya sp.]
MFFLEWVQSRFADNDDTVDGHYQHRPGYGADDLIRLAVLTARKGKADGIGWPSAPSLMAEAKHGEPATWCGPLPSDPDVLVGNLPGLEVAPVDAVVSLCRVGMAEMPDGVERHRIRLIDKPGKPCAPHFRARPLETGSDGTERGALVLRGHPSCRQTGRLRCVNARENHCALNRLGSLTIDDTATNAG